ncbi:hypothetical protein Syun_027596 [Stephania yunnanensis]|uniref:Uncharacterized protein n=1 Tax=Stephania yunnanensis TaxID=152371 RepID=A0AAP0HRE3_9MAGN
MLFQVKGTLYIPPDGRRYILPTSTQVLKQTTRKNDLATRYRMTKGYDTCETECAVEFVTENTLNGVFTCSDQTLDSLPRNMRCAVGRIADRVFQPIR